MCTRVFTFVCACACCLRLHPWVMDLLNALVSAKVDDRTSLFAVWQKRPNCEYNSALFSFSNIISKDKTRDDHDVASFVSRRYLFCQPSCIGSLQIKEGCVGGGGGGAKTLGWYIAIACH